MRLYILQQASKQAYLIIAHKADTVFSTLIQMLDHPKNDIFIHMDAKTKDYNPADTQKLVKDSRIFHTRRVKVSWGGYSQVEAALILLEAATSQGQYEHYHLLSGQDLPIKRQEEIQAFFERNHGVEFMNFQSETFGHDEWVRYYYPLQEMIGRPRRKISRAISRVFSKIQFAIQRAIRIYRNKGVKFQKGTDWFSITDQFARYVLSNREWIHKVFHDTFMPTEVYMHTIMVNSPFRSKLYQKEFIDDHVKAVARLIDWRRGGPYTFRSSDLEEIRSSEAMFARKFDENVDSEVVRKIQELYS
ncbi:MAG: hypothetical protein IJG65_08280 [Synergistaceae bacterium]|nr:hypothetical protein [Synergistaceae bacterium]